MDLSNAMKRIQNLMTNKVRVIVGIGFGAYLYVKYRDVTRYSRISNSFARGHMTDSVKEYHTVYFRRPEFENKIKKILSPEFTSHYHIIYGPSGSGKTRSVVEVAKKLIEEEGRNGKGAPVYVSLVHGWRLPTVLADAVQFKFDEHISFEDETLRLVGKQNRPKVTEKSETQRVLKAIDKSLAIYNKRYDKPAVIVIDGLDTGLKEMGSGTVQILQQKAMQWADRNMCKVVFVISSPKTIELLKDNKSVWERADIVFNSPPLTKEEAIQFLTDPYIFKNQPQTASKHPISESDALDLYTIFGGRILHLKQLKENIMKGGISKEDAIEKLVTREMSKISDVILHREQRKAILMLRNATENGDQVSLEEMVKKMSEKALHELIRDEIMALEITSNGVNIGFASCLTKYVVEKAFFEEAS